MSIPSSPRGSPRVNDKPTHLIIPIRSAPSYCDCVSINNVLTEFVYQVIGLRAGVVLIKERCMCSCTRRVR